MPVSSSRNVRRTTPVPVAPSAPKRGRPAGSLNRRVPAEEVEEEPEAVVSSPRRGRPVQTAKTAVSTPVKPVATRKVKPFPDFNESWEGYPVREYKMRGGKPTKVPVLSDADYAKVVQGARLKHGRLRKAYESQQGTTAEPAAKQTPAEPVKRGRPAGAKPAVPAANDGEKTYGGATAWCDFPSPSEIEYALAQLENAIGSKVYSVSHGGKHPFSIVAQGSYYAAVNRQYVAEERVQTLLDNGAKLPKGTQFNPEYYGLTINDMSDPEKSALEQYPDFVDEYNANKKDSQSPLKTDILAMFETKKKPAVKGRR